MVSQVRVYEDLSFSAEGGTSPYAFTLDGTLPEGMSFDDGTLSGTPTENGNFRFNVIATDSDDFTGQRSYTLNIGAPGITLTPDVLATTQVYADYTQTFTAQGGTAPYSYRITDGRLPNGMSLEDGNAVGRIVRGWRFHIHPDCNR